MNKRKIKAGDLIKIEIDLQNGHGLEIDYGIVIDFIKCNKFDINGEFLSQYCVVKWLNNNSGFWGDITEEREEQLILVLD